jgi:hypothetical protein
MQHRSSRGKTVVQNTIYGGLTEFKTKSVPRDARKGVGLACPCFC